VFNAIASCGVAGFKRRRIARLSRDLFVVEWSDGRALSFVERGRRRLYRRGYDERLNTVARRYGCGHSYEIAPDDFVIDVGANVGEFSLFAAQHGARVLAIDPDHRNLAALAGNLKRLSKVAFAGVACADNDGARPFYESVRSADSSLIRPGRGRSIISPVEIRRLDSLVSDLAITRVAVLKIDAQGSEPEVLRGASDILARTSIVAVDVSAERNGLSTRKDCTSILGDAGFEIVSLKNVLVARSRSTGASES